LKKLLITAVLVFAAVNFTSCRAAQKEKPQIYASFFVMYDFALQIAGANADVYCIVPSGAGAHNFEPTPQDMAAVSEADIFFYSDSVMEPWAGNVADAAQNTPAVSLSEGLYEENADPHVWLNPNYALKMMEVILVKLISADPDNTDSYIENYNIASEKIDALNQSYIDAQLSGKTILCYHAAYTHLCDEYGMTQKSVEETGNSAEVSASKIAETIEFINENEIKYIFAAPYGYAGAVDVITRETAAKRLELNPCEILDEKSRADGADYFSIMYANLENLKTGAQYTASGA
jgi:zinc transport system substrate-binding protein